VGRALHSGILYHVAGRHPVRSGGVDCTVGFWSLCSARRIGVNIVDKRLLSVLEYWPP